MILEGITFCDGCAGVAFPNDSTTIHLKDAEGHSHAFQFHNTADLPCLKRKIDELRQQFESLAAQN